MHGTTLMSKVTSIRLSDELAAGLEQLSASLDRPKAWLMEQAIARYVEEESWQVAAITEALVDYRKGTVTLSTHDTVMRRMDEKLSRHD